MKTIRGFIAVIMSLCMCLCMPAGAFAASNTECVETVTITSEYGFELPADAIIVYEDEGICMYQSLSKSAEESEIVPYVDDNYGYAWVSSDDTGTFNVNCTLTGTVKGTFKVESSKEASVAKMTISGPMAQLAVTKRLHPSHGDVYFTLNGCQKGTYEVSYIANTTVGMRLMCWLYK